MMGTNDSTTEPAFRFKRRKVAHAKRAPLDDVPTTSVPGSPSDAATPTDAIPPPKTLVEDDESAPNLREILRNRKRPRDRVREAARRSEPTQTRELVTVDAPKQDLYASRFVAQTGQVVDKDDKQMSEYIEARLAEKNHRLYGWPIPKHLEAVVAVLTPEPGPATPSDPHAKPAAVPPVAPVEQSASVSVNQSQRLAAGMGKLHEVDLGPDAITRNIERTEAAWKKLEGVEEEKETDGKLRLGRNGKPRRPPKRRNSEDMRRDQMVEAVLREAKLDFFEEDRPPSPPATGDLDNDDAMVEKFRQEFFESCQQRKPAPPPGGKGVKEAPKGPRLGGSRSARAAMRMQEDQAAKSKR